MCKVVLGTLSSFKSQLKTDHFLSLTPNSNTFNFFQPASSKYVCVCVCMCVHMCMHVSVFVCMPVRTHVCVCLYWEVGRVALLVGQYFKPSQPHRVISGPKGRWGVGGEECLMTNCVDVSVLMSVVLV